MPATTAVCRPLLPQTPATTKRSAPVAGYLLGRLLLLIAMTESRPASAQANSADPGSATGSQGCYFGECPGDSTTPNPPASPTPRQPASQRVFRDCDSCPELVSLPAGSYQRSAVSNVSIAAFALGKTDVTEAQWQAVMGSNRSRFKHCGADCPVESVSWDDAQTFIKRLNKRTGQHYRLPSETEWEYACHAGLRPQRYCGSDSIDAVGWYLGNSGGRTHPVAAKQPNGWGLYDMSGNVPQWLDDCWHEDSKLGSAPADGSAWTTGGVCASHVLRGGSWSLNASDNRASFRFFDDTGSRHEGYGFRLARTLP